MTNDNAAPGGIRVIAAAIMLITLVGVALSVSNPLLSLTLEQWGTSSTLSGLTATGAGLGTVLIVPLVPLLARMLGIPVVLGGALAVSALGMSSFYLFPNIAAWAALRFMLGCGLGLIFTLAEYWINAAAPPEKRGFVMGCYATAIYAGFALGPIIFGLVGTKGALPFLVTGGIMALGLIPLVLAGKRAPRLDEPATGTVLGFIFAAPTATFGAFIFGALETGVIIMLAVHAVRLGFTELQAGTLLSAFTLGNVLFQLPIGLISDRVDRRKLLLTLSSFSTLLALALPYGPPDIWRFAALLFFLGGISGAIYSVGLAHLGARFSGTDLASANAAFVMLYSIGLMVGPLLIGYAMDKAGVLGLPLAVAVMLGSYALLVLVRLRQKP
ncbi:MAG: MFS transporter [Rhizobiales bacterium PAR1]|nr:MAG: MFS transporter [Rhizobiales bacterium PAR1]